jgi:hypothetical protein
MRRLSRAMVVIGVLASVGDVLMQLMPGYA